MGKLIVECWKEDLWLKMLTITTIILLVTSFFLPPTGEINSTVFVATGELFAFASLWQLNKAINKNLSAKIKVKELELEIMQRKRKLEEPTNDGEINIDE